MKAFALTPIYACESPGIFITTGLAKRKHLLEVVVKSTSETIDRWAKQRTAVTFTGLLLDNGATVSPPVRKPFNILIFGDSITEGVRVNGYAGIANDTDRNDALQVYSWLLSQELPAEVGVVGFGATGINTAGSGGVPTLGKSYALLWAGQPRSFSDPEPDLIVYNEGTNYTDATATNATSYYYVISASLRTGETANSSEVRIAPPAPVRMGASFHNEIGLLSLSWPAWATNHTLWEATNLSPPVQWQCITNTPQESNELLSLTLPVVKEGQQYFRLQAP